MRTMDNGMTWARPDDSDRMALRLEVRRPVWRRVCERQVVPTRDYLDELVREFESLGGTDQ